MKLYHGTSLKNLRKILKQKNISPRKKRDNGNWATTLKSNGEMVYLTNSYACYFALNTTYHLADDEIKEGDYDPSDYDDDKPVVLEIEVSKKNLYPDEDAMEQLSRHKGWINDHIKEFMTDYGEGIEYMADRTQFFIDNYEIYKDCWKLSLETLGTVCHKGAIHSNNITRVAYLHPHVIHLSQPTITLQNFRHLGENYKKECRELIWTKEYSSQVLNKKQLKTVII